MNSDCSCAVRAHARPCSPGLSWSYFYLFPFSCCLSCFILGAFFPWATIIIFQWFTREKNLLTLNWPLRAHTHSLTHIHSLWKPWTSTVCVWIQFYLSHASFQRQETFNSRFPASGFRPLTSKVKSIFLLLTASQLLSWVKGRKNLKEKKKKKEMKW